MKENITLITGFIIALATFGNMLLKWVKEIKKKQRD
jgi:hypothetical protein